MDNIEFRNKILTTQKLIFVGLGNITSKYDNTRHNAGFNFIDYFIAANSLPDLRSESKFDAYINRYKIREYDLVLVKPTTFMNLSGESVAKVLDYLGLKDENLILIHDDLDIPLGEYKINFNKGPKEHNGVNSVVNRIDTSEFWRIRIGVENRTGDSKKIPGDKFVIMQMNAEEREELREVTQELVEDISQLIF